MAAMAKMSLSGSITPSRMSGARTYVSVFFCALSFLTLSSLASADCVVEREPAGESHLFIRHFASGCSKLDREARAVGAGEILGALRAGKGVSLMNAVIKGDLLLTQLNSVPLASIALPEPVLARLSQSRVTELRVIRGSLVLENSVVDGIIDTQLNMTEHRLLGDMLVIQGPVSFKGTTFTKEVDLSRTVFLETVDSSNAIYLGDAFFLACIFTKSTVFEKTAFSANSRFYQAMFEGPVTFRRAGFNGLTNFLSVWFKKESSFSRAYFRMGTGFSGSRFDGISDFSEAVFEKSAFFMTTVFGADTYFRRAAFRGEASFSDAAFQGKDDFSKVFYREEPNFSRATFATPRSSVGFENPVFLIIVAASLTIFLIAFIIILKKG
jgi:uncharacterized protein YjbI with pentapeptide repeats